ncbi:MAG: hypothetical protein ACR2KK_03760 [Acidimicrobiales bacterium]
MRSRLSGEDVTVLGAAGVFVIATLLPWYSTDFGPVAQGIDPPYAGLVQLAAVAAAVMGRWGRRPSQRALPGSGQGTPARWPHILEGRDGGQERQGRPQPTVVRSRAR